MHSSSSKSAPSSTKKAAVHPYFIPTSVLTELFTSGISVGTANTITNPLGKCFCAGNGVRVREQASRHFMSYIRIDLRAEALMASGPLRCLVIKFM